MAVIYDINDVIRSNVKLRTGPKLANYDGYLYKSLRFALNYVKGPVARIRFTTVTEAAKGLIGNSI